MPSHDSTGTFTQKVRAVADELAEKPTIGHQIAEALVEGHHTLQRSLDGLMTAVRHRPSPAPAVPGILSRSSVFSPKGFEMDTSLTVDQKIRLAELAVQLADRESEFGTKTWRQNYDDLVAAVASPASATSSS